LLQKVAFLKGSAILLKKVIIVKLADWDTVKSNIFAKTAIQFVQRLPEARLLKSVDVPFWKGRA
jgi:hypothetical protein